MMAERPRDLAWEALVRATHANPHMERGKLNAALKAIREAAHGPGGEGIHPDELPAEIERRADAYRDKWPNLTLTPTALATHWFRVLVTPQQRSRQEEELRKLREGGS